MLTNCLALTLQILPSRALIFPCAAPPRVQSLSAVAVASQAVVEPFLLRLLFKMSTNDINCDDSSPVPFVIGRPINA